MIAKASNIDGLNTLCHFIFIPILHFEDQVKIAKLVSHSIVKRIIYTYFFVMLKLTIDTLARSTNNL